MKVRKSIATVTGIALLVFATGAIAADDGLSGTVGIRGKNTLDRTIKLGDRTFRLDGNSVIRDAEGERVSLDALAVPDFAHGGKDPVLGAMVGQYTAARNGSQLILQTLELQKTMD